MVNFIARHSAFADIDQAHTDQDRRDAALLALIVIHEEAATPSSEERDDCEGLDWDAAWEEFTEAAPDHPPSEHRCEHMPMSTYGPNDCMVIICQTCQTIWYTECESDDSDQKVYQYAEAKYGGHPEALKVATNGRHPLYYVYHVPPGKQRCWKCGRIQDEREFPPNRDRKSKARLDRNCYRCHESVYEQWYLTTEQMERLQAKQRSAQPKPFKFNAPIAGRR